MAILKGLNVLVSFLLELATLAAFAYWAYHAVENPWVKWVVAIAAPLAVAILWGLFLAPKAGQRVGSTVGITVSLLVFYVAALGLFGAGQTALGIVMMVLATLNRALVAVWRQW